MKVTRNTDDILVVEDRPWLIAIMLVLFILIFVGVGIFLISDGIWAGLIFAIFGGGMGVMALIVFVRRTQAVFHRPEGWVEIRQKSLIGTTKQRFRLGDISGAHVETSHSSDSQNRSSTTHRAALVIPQGPDTGRHPITSVYSSGKGAHTITAAINDWLPATDLSDA